jgi:hypothetical protein
MLNATQKELDHVLDYMTSQAADYEVEFVQKIYSEIIVDRRHDVWDVHTDADRWWVITNPTNLYSQVQFPNMDLALTFHIGLCIRVPRSEKLQLANLPVEPFAECFRYLADASDAMKQAQEVADYQAIGVRCRETLLAFGHAGQIVIPWTSEKERPKTSDFKEWVEHICNTSLAGSSQEYRRRLYKTLLNGAWTFSNWLAHTKSSSWHDAEAACATTENAVALSISAVIQFIRGVPEVCPACGSHRLSPERAHDPNNPDDEWERPACTRCSWVGEPVKIERVPTAPRNTEAVQADSDCIVPTVPLRKLKKPVR